MNREADLKRFDELSEQEILALAISNEEEDNRIYRAFAEGLRQQYPASARVFDEMAEEEVHHRAMLFDLYRSKFGDYLPLIRRQDVKGFVHHKPLWLVRPLGLVEVRKYAEAMEYETARFYRKASQSARDASVRQLLDKVAEAEDELGILCSRAVRHARAGAVRPQSPAPGFGEKYWSLSGFPSHSLESGGGAFLTIILGQIFGVFRIQRQPFLKFRLGVGLDRVDRAFRLADPAIDAFVRVDDEHLPARQQTTCPWMARKYWCLPRRQSGMSGRPCRCPHS